MATKFKSVDAAAAGRIVDGGAHVIDVRNEDEFAAGHIEGADRIPVGRISSHSVGRADTVIAVCSNGARSKRAAKKLAKEGYQVYHLDGGLEAWTAGGMALVSSTGDRARIL